MAKQNSAGDLVGGRPRDERIDSAVLAAAAALLAEVGYADLTVAAIAERAGTSRPAVYRRWPSKAHLVHEAAFGGNATGGAPGTGSFAGDIRELVRRTADLLTTPLARVAVPGLIAEAAHDPVLHQRLLERFATQGWGGLEAHLTDARERGDLAADVDATQMLEMVIGAALAATLVRGPDNLDDAWVDATTRILLRGVQAG
ncbi:MAG: TetR/AcrR family transcriptional regulator [Propionibacteriales bacterium]|nr:TetR/AcrR family transcriptional regulator [Propionibacteriales bacterium]